MNEKQQIFKMKSNLLFKFKKKKKSRKNEHIQPEDWHSRHTMHKKTPKPLCSSFNIQNGCLTLTVHMLHIEILALTYTHRIFFLKVIFYRIFPIPSSLPCRAWSRCYLKRSLSVCDACVRRLGGLRKFRGGTHDGVISVRVWRRDEIWDTVAFIVQWALPHS